MTARPGLNVMLTGFLWAALTVTVFSGWFVVTRFGVTHDLRVWDVIALRFGGGAAILLPVLLWQRHRLPPHAWREGLLLALLWGAPFVLLVALGIQLTSVAQAAATAPTLMPVFAGLIAWLLLRERPGGWPLLGYVAILAGLLLLLGARTLLQGMPDPAGIACLVLGAFLWAVYTLRFRRSGLTAMQAAALVAVWSAVLYLPAYLFLNLSRLHVATLPELAFQAFYQGCLMSAVAIVAFNRAVTLLGPGAAAAIIALVPVLAALFAIPALGEIPAAPEGLAIGIIAIGVLLAAQPKSSPSKQVSP